MQGGPIFTIDLLQHPLAFQYSMGCLNASAVGSQSIYSLMFRLRACAYSIGGIGGCDNYESSVYSVSHTIISISQN